jgi:hypothetical protein
LARFNIRWAVFLAVFALSSVYFFVFGESGILERMNLEKEKSSIDGTIRALKNENDGLRKRLDSYRKGQYTAEDYLESGYVGPGDRVLLFQGLALRPASGRLKETGRTNLTRLLPSLRIIWVSLSVVLVLGLFLYNKKLKSRVPS